MTLAVSQRNFHLDGILSAAASLLAAVAAIILFFDIHVFVREVEASKKSILVADLDNLQGDVRTREAHVLAWDRATKGDGVHMKDFVFTDESSSVSLKFKDKTKIQLGENTLLAIERVGNEASLNIVKGNFSIVPNTLSKGLNVTFGKERTPLTIAPSTALQLTVSKERGAELKIISGKAVLEVAGKNVDIAANQEARLMANGLVVRAAPVALMTPKNEETLRIEKNERVKLTWRSELKSGFKVEVAVDQSFKKIYRSSISENKFFEVSLSESGVYYWRVGFTKNSENPDNQSYEYSETRTFVANVIRPLNLYLPLAEETFHLGRTIPQLVWEKAINKTNYKVEVANTNNFLSLLATTLTSKESWIVPSLPEGEYFWRVQDPLLGKDSWSEVRRFFIVAEDAEMSRELKPTKKPLKAPALPKKIEIQLPFLVPKEMRKNRNENNWPWIKKLGEVVVWCFEERALAKNAEEANFSQGSRIKWPVVDGASAYAVELARDQLFAEIIIKKNVFKPEFKLDGLAPGNYYLRIAAIGADGEQSDFSEPSIVTITGAIKEKLYPPKPVTPLDAAVIYISNGAPVVSLKWEAAERASSYFIEISRDSTFSEDGSAFKKHLRGLDANAPLELGKYFWRLRSIRKLSDDDKEDLSSWSMPLMFEIQKKSQAPVVSVPVDPPKKAVVVKKISENQKRLNTIQSVPMKKSLFSVFFMPTRMSYLGTGKNAVETIDAMLFNSFGVAYNHWFKTVQALDFDLQRTATVLFRESNSDDPDAQSPVKLELIKSKIQGRLRFGETQGVLSQYMDIRGGYGWIQAAKFSRVSEEASEKSSIRVKPIICHGPAFGAEVGKRLASSWWTRFEAVGLYGVAIQRDSAKTIVDLVAKIAIEQDPDIHMVAWNFGLSVGSQALNIETGSQAKTTSSALHLGATYGF